MKIYLVVLVNGTRKVFTNVYNRNAYLNRLDAKNSFLRITAKLYEYEVDLD